MATKPDIAAPGAAPKSKAAVALSKELHRVNELDAGLDAELVEGRTPLVAQGVQITPTGSNRFKTTDTGVVYLEIYAPALLGAKPPDVGIELKIVNRKSGQTAQDSGMIKVNTIRPDNAVVPIGLKLPVNTLVAGSYRVELQAVDSAGRSTAPRSTDFEVE